MLAPIITKDMKLFPSQPLPSNVRNVRSRAQSLDDLKNPGTGKRNRVANQRRQRGFQSVDSLPIPSKLPSKHSPATSSLKKSIVLDAIVEGVEMRTMNSRMLRAYSDDTVGTTVATAIGITVTAGAGYCVPRSGNRVLNEPSMAVTASSCSLVKDASPSRACPSPSSIRDTATTGNKDTAKSHATTANKDAAKSQTTTTGTSAGRSIAKWFNNLRSKPKVDSSSVQHGKVRRLSNSKS